MSTRARARRSTRVAATKPKPQDIEEMGPDCSASETTSNSCTTSVPSSPRPSTPSIPSSPTSSLLGSPTKQGFVRLDHLLRLNKSKENLENSTMAIAALTALASGESALIPSLDECIKAKLQRQTEDLQDAALVEGSGQLRISLVCGKRRPRKASKKTKIYTF